MLITAPSKRYYVGEMSGFHEGKAALAMLCDCKIRAYEHAYRRRFYPDGFPDDPFKGKSRPVYDELRSLGLSGYYSNSLEPYVIGMIKSQVSNLANYVSNIKDDIESMCEKKAETETELARKRLIKEAIVRYAKTDKWEPPFEGCTMYINDRGEVIGFGIKAQDYRVYERTVEAGIRRYKQRVASIGEGIKRREKKLKDLEKGIPTKSIFGSRALYKKKDTVCETAEDREIWREEFIYARHSSIVLSGRADAPSGNRIVKWDERTHDLVWDLPGGGTCVFPGFLPENYTEEYASVLASKNASHTSVSYTIDLRKDSKGREFFLVWATFKLPDDSRMNFCTEGGVVGVDINADRLAWTELDGEGNRLCGDVIPMNLAGLTSGQASDVIGRAVSVLISQCSLSGKPLIRENLDSGGFAKKMKYDNKKRNRVVSQFAFERIIQSIMSQAFRAGIGVYAVNPAYTSFAAKTAYMRRYGISIHEAASYVIGMFGLGIWPEVPEQYKGLLPKPKKSPKSPEASKSADTPKASETAEASKTTETPKAVENADTSESAETSKASKTAAKDALPSPREKFYKDWKALYNMLKGIRTHAFYLDIPKCKNKRELKKWIQEHDVIRPPNSYAPPKKKGGDAPNSAAA